MHHNPEVVDMLVCLTGAAATGDLKRFNPFPNGVEAKIGTYSASGGQIDRYIDA